MKAKLLMFATCLSFAFSAQALELKDVVLGVDFTDFEYTEQFPCSIYQDVMFCYSNLKLEKNCASTLKISKSSKTLSCQGLSGNLVVFGKIDENSFTADWTNPGTGSLRVEFSSEVELKKLATPLGNEEFELIVK